MIIHLWVIAFDEILLSMMGHSWGIGSLLQLWNKIKFPRISRCQIFPEGFFISNATKYTELCISELWRNESMFYFIFFVMKPGKVYVKVTPMS